MRNNNPNITKYLDNRGIYSPLLSEKIREEYKNQKVFKGTPHRKSNLWIPIATFVNKIFKEKIVYKQLGLIFKEAVNLLPSGNT